MKSWILILLFAGLTVLPQKVYSQNNNMGGSSELESILKDPRSKDLKKSSKRILKETKSKIHNDRRILEDILEEGDSDRSFLEKIDEYKDSGISELDQGFLKELRGKPGVVDPASNKISKKAFNMEYMELLKAHELEKNVDMGRASKGIDGMKEGNKSFKKDSLSNGRLLEMGEETLEKELGKTEQVKNFGELVNESDNPFDIPAFEDVLPQGASEMKSLPSQFGIKHFEGKESKILAAIEQVQDLKKKYRYVPDSENLDDALKQNSLKDASFRERIEWEGNFNIQWGKPFIMDFGPSLGYKFSKIFSGGLSGVVRMNIRNKNDADFSNVGYRLYARYGVFHSFFVHGEFETVYGKFKPKEQSISSIQSLQSLNVGLGKKFNISKGIKGRLVVLYNIPLDNHEHYRSPWIFRMGIGR